MSRASEKGLFGAKEEYVLSWKFFLDDFSVDVSSQEREIFSETRTLCGVMHNFYNLYKIQPSEYDRLQPNQKNELREAMKVANKALLQLFGKKYYFTALHYAKIAYGLALKSCDPKIKDEALLIAMAAYNVGAILQDAGKHEKAIPFLEESLKVRAQYPDQGSVAAKSKGRLDRALEATENTALKMKM